VKRLLGAPPSLPRPLRVAPTILAALSGLGQSAIGLLGLPPDRLRGRPLGAQRPAAFPPRVEDIQAYFQSPVAGSLLPFLPDTLQTKLHPRAVVGRDIR
jgi:hypothetical protein